MGELVYWIWLSLAVTEGSNTFNKLLCGFNSPEEIYNAGREDYVSCIGSASKDLSALCDKNLDRATKICDFCSRKEIGILTYNDVKFPKFLREIKNPPVLLYYRGVLPDFNSECFISVVGTRRLSDYGRKNAFTIGRDLAKAGAIVVSGMAIGIDSVSLAGALSQNAVTVAFLGSGINVCYPECHKTLAKAIVEKGCILTEYPPNTEPNGRNFPIRNRLISGVSCATVVIEGGENSGSMITARKAKEQGRAIYALPGNVDNKTSAVSNSLIKNGAKLITDAYDIVRDFEYQYLGKLNPFNMQSGDNHPMMEILTKYKVNCVTHSDSVFAHNGSSKRKEVSVVPTQTDKTDTSVATSTVETDKTSSIAEAGFDKNTMEIYLKIPKGSEVPYSDLTDEKHSMKDVVRALFRLNLGNFVVLLPGERVKRSF